MADEDTINELDEFREFLKEALLRMDPSLDVAAGSPAETEVISPAVQRLAPDPYDTPLATFIKERLRSQFPDLILQDNDVLDDYGVKIMRVLLEPFRRQINLLSKNQSLQDPEQLNEDEADRLAANFFVRRRLGGFAVGIARLYYSAPQAIIVTPSNPVYTAGGLRFFPVENQAINAIDMQLNIEGGLYYFDVVVRAEKAGDEYNIDVDDGLVGVEGLSQTVKVENKTSFEEGAPRESTEEFVERVENSLSERSLVTARGITARLLDVFENVRSVQVIGFGDIEMERDILESTADYVYGNANWVDTAGWPTYPDIMVLNGFYANGVGSASFSAYGRVGDKVIINNTGSSDEFTITEILTAVSFRVTPIPTAFVSGRPIFTRAGPGMITISNIPGGIVDPETDEGTISVENNEVHIGGALDVFIRAGFPQQRSTTVESIRDAEPLRFGVDLESFAESYSNHDGTRLINITEYLEEAVIVGGVASPTDYQLGLLDILIPKDSPEWGWDPPPAGGKPEMIWVPSESDVGRFAQLTRKVGTSSSLEFGTFEIDSYRGYGTFEFQSKNDGPQTVEGWVFTLKGDNVEIPGSTTLTSLGQTDSNGPPPTGDYDTIRFREEVSMAPVVRDRDATRTPAGVDFDVLGAEIGDSLIIEAGDDAGIYTIRRLLTTIDTNDTLLLSQNLTKTITTSGTGNGSGHRYRIADELNINLIEPRTTKIPQGAIFEGDDLVTTAGSQVVTLTGGGNTDFELAGVDVNDTLEILTGDSAGTYTILEVYADSLKVTPETPSTTFDVDFSVYTEFTAIDRPLVRVSEVQLLDSSSQETGITIPFGDYIDARAKGVFSNQGRGMLVESYTGETSVPSTLSDAQVDFVDEGARVGDRVVILEENNAGEYEITGISTTTNPNDTLSLLPAASGGKDLSTSIVSPAGVHYRVGGPSLGWVRMYFLEPTSVTVQTGPAGGRLRHQVTTDSYQDFRFSEHEGYTVLPAGGSGDDSPRDLRVIHSSYVGPDYETILELVGPDVPDAFDLELEAGDVMEVFEPISFRDSGGTVLGYGELFSPPGLKTIAGSNLVEVPECSAIDFEQMDLPGNGGPIVGQLLYIVSGPDEGQYTITEVVSAKQLRLSSVMASTTQAWLAQDNSTPGDGVLDTSDPIQLSDPTDNPVTGASAGQYITIFEITDPNFQTFGGTFEIDSVQLTYLELVDHPEAGGTGMTNGFKWLRTTGSTNVFQPFSVYKAVPTELPILQVATVGSEIISGGPAEIQVVSGKAKRLEDLTKDFAGAGVQRGDMVEIVHSGNPYNPDNVGVYHVSAAFGATWLEVHHDAPFESADSDVYYRIWGGPFGSRRLITVDGHVAFGVNIPFRIRRPAVFHVSSTEMEDNFDGVLYYADIQVESLGPGDALNIEKDERLEITSGLEADGYTYEVENNTLTFSPYEEVSLKFDRRFLPAGNSDLPENLTEITARNLQIIAEVSSTVRAINDLMRSDTERPVNANPIARHVLPSYVYLSMVYRGGSSQSIVGQEIEDYINKLGALDELEVSDIERFIHRRGAHSIDHPIELVTVTHDLDRNLIVDRSYDSLGGTDVPYNGTGRISSFFAKVGEGLSVTRES